MAITGVQSKTDLCIHLLTTTPLTERTYYTLYVDNPHVGRVCALWNRFIFFLFGSLGWFLGEAADTHNQILIKHEVTLIKKYNQAKADLLTALVQLKSNPATKEHFETACKTYETAIKMREQQITHQFGFSQEARLLGLKIEKSDLWEAAKQDLRALVKQHELEIDRAELPVHLLEEVDSTQNNSNSLPVKTLPESEKPTTTPPQTAFEDEDEEFFPPSEPKTPNSSWNITGMLYSEETEPCLPKFLERETALFEAFKAHAGKIQSLKDSTLIPQEMIEAYVQALVKCHFSKVQTIEISLLSLQQKYRDAHLSLARAFLILVSVVLKTLKEPSFAFDLNVSPLFLKFADDYLGSFVKAFTPELAAKNKFCYSKNPLPIMYTTLKTLYQHTHPTQSVEECEEFAKKELNSLLHLLYKEKCNLFKVYFTAEKLNGKESEELFLIDLYKALQSFKTNPTEAEKADLDRFLQQIIKNNSI
jgi:hypothetical protein